MGVIIDSTVVIAAERKREALPDLLRRVYATVGEQEVALSSVGYGELVHGIYRETVLERQVVRRKLLDDLKSSMWIYPYTDETAELAGRIDAEQRNAGLTVPFSDLLIGATALSLGFSILTGNARHFRLIPGLNVILF